LVDQATVIDRTTVLFLAVLTILLLLVWIYVKHLKQNNLYITLKIGDHNKCIRIRCMRLFTALYAYQFHSATYIETISTAKNWPAIYIKWPTFEITHILEGISLKFPTHVLISPWAMFQIQHILKRKAFYVLCLLEYNGNFRLVDFETVEPPSGQTVLVRQNDLDEPQTARYGDTVSVALPLHLYPSLSQLPVVD